MEEVTYKDRASESSNRNMLGSIRNVIHNYKADGRDQQIAFLLVFLSYGVLFLDWQWNSFYYLTVIASCLLAQGVVILFTKKGVLSLKSALISSLSLCLLLKTNLLTTAMLASAISIWGKFLFRRKGKHIFNPTNLGIIATILITGDAWVSPGQWGSHLFFLILIGVTGAAVLFKVGRIDTGLAFLLTFGVLQFIRMVLYLGWEFDVYLHQMTNGTLLLFAFFMITDPVTTPNDPWARIIWAALIGATTFFLTGWMYVHTAPLWALFMFSPLTALFDKLFVKPKFQWS